MLLGLALLVAAALSLGDFRRPNSTAGEPSREVAQSVQIPTVSAYPMPGTVTATTRTQISLRGAPPSELGRIEVIGSRSGRHAGRLRGHSDGQGASFLPNRPFTPGESVRVRTGLDIVGASRGDFSFRVGRRPPLPRLRPAEPPWVGRGKVQRYRTRPELRPPAVAVTTRGPGTAPGLIFLGAKGGRGQDGPMIIDETGRLIWFKATPNRELVTDFRVQTYRGKPVLTWWQGRLFAGDGRGQGVIYDDRYRPVRRVRAGNGLHADLHEFEITPHGSALLIIYDPVRRPEGIVLQAVVQEIDIETGLVLFEWHSIGNVALSETFRSRPGRNSLWDYVHLNSVALDEHGDFIVSARATNAVYRISRATGRIVWRLGGKRSDFKLGRGASFALQHDARPQPDGSITIYDNSATPPVRKHSRAITLVLNEQRKTATLRRALTHPEGLLAATQGNMQALPGGNTFVGWGSQRWFSEYDANGRLVLDGQLARGNDSYRAYRLPWIGRPVGPPKLVATRSGGRVTARVSWNGATEVASWLLLAGATPNALQPLASAPDTQFETALTAATRERYVAVQALDAAGAVLGTSRALRP